MVAKRQISPVRSPGRDRGTDPRARVFAGRSGVAAADAPAGRGSGDSAGTTLQDPGHRSGWCRARGGMRPGSALSTERETELQSRVAAVAVGLGRSASDRPRRRTMSLPPGKRSPARADARRPRSDRRRGRSGSLPRAAASRSGRSGGVRDGSARCSHASTARLKANPPSAANRRLPRPSVSQIQIEISCRTPECAKLTTVCPTAAKCYRVRQPYYDRNFWYFLRRLLVFDGLIA